jgi:hypothetical protein
MVQAQRIEISLLILKPTDVHANRVSEHNFEPLSVLCQSLHCCPISGSQSATPVIQHVAVVGGADE